MKPDFLSVGINTDKLTSNLGVAMGGSTALDHDCQARSRLRAVAEDSDDGSFPGDEKCGHATKREGLYRGAPRWAAGSHGAQRITFGHRDPHGIERTLL